MRLVLLLIAALGAAIAQPPAKRARLGETHYTSPVGGAIGQRGKHFELRLERVTAITVCTSADQLKLIHAVTFTQGATERTFGRRQVNSACAAPFELAPGRHITGIAGASGWYVDSLQFLLDDGSRSPRYGGAGGDSDWTLQVKNGRFLGFWGTTDGGFIETLGLIFWPAA
jgi:hypothetical protein